MKDDQKMKHAPIIQEAINRNKRAGEAWEAYQHEILGLELQVSFLHRDTIGMYTCDGDQIADFLIKQKDKLAKLRQTNAKFIAHMLKTKKDSIEKAILV